jgi:pre-mRNA-splicing factor ATP-dependent RNA helicase DHX15/PRP43
LAICKNLVEVRKDLKLILMSATLEVDKFSKYFNTDCILKIEGRTFPIEVYNSVEEEKNYIVLK